MKRWLWSVLPALVVVVLAPGAASAANISFSDVAGLSPVTPDGNFDRGGFTQSTTGNTTTFSGGWLSNNATSGSGSIYFTENNGTFTSDLLTISWSGPGGVGNETITGTWTVGLGTPPPAGATTLAEPFSGDITAQFPNLAANLTMQATATSVPEPSTLTLLGLGSLGLLGYGWRRRKQVV